MGKVSVYLCVDVAACLCPAYDISTAFTLFHRSYPRVEARILRSVKQNFIEKNREILMQADELALEACLAARSLEEFIVAHAPFAGVSNAEEYIREFNPMQWAAGIRVPTLLLNAEDDILCVKECIDEDFVRNQAGGVLVVTQRGSHIAFCEGLFGTGSFMTRVTLDWFEAALRTARMDREGRNQ